MRPLPQDAGDQRDVLEIELVCNAVRGNGRDAGIADHDLLMGPGSRVPVEGRLHISLEPLADLRQLHEQVHGGIAGLGSAVTVRALVQAAVVPVGPLHLLRETRLDLAEDVPHHVADVGPCDRPAPRVPWEQDLKEQVQGLHNLAPDRQTGGVDEVDATVPLVGGCDPVHQGLDLLVRKSFGLHLFSHR